MKFPSRTGLASAILPAVLAFVPFAILLQVVWRNFVDVPFWDEWVLVTRLERLLDGSLTLVDLWGQHNEHRPLFGIALLLVMARATQWNTAFEVAANVAAGTMIFAVFARHVLSQWPVEYRRPFWLLPVLSLFVFSPSQWENWLWGWQISIFLNVLAVAAGLGLMARLDGRWSRLAGALLCGVVATYSFASGLVYWVAGAGAWWLNRSQRKPAQILVWAAVALLTIASYFYDYRSLPGHQAMLPNFAGLQQFASYLQYCAAYTGAAVAGYSHNVAAMAGGTAVALFLWLAFSNRELAGKPIYTFALLNGVHCLAAAMMTGLGRAGQGIEQSLSSRYVTMSTPLWIVIFVLAALLLSRHVREREVNGARPAARAWWIADVLVVIVASTLISLYMGANRASTKRENLEEARRALVAGQDDALLLRLYPGLDNLRDWRHKLVAWRYSVFRDGAAPPDRPRSWRPDPTR